MLEWCELNSALNLTHTKQTESGTARKYIKNIFIYEFLFFIHNKRKKKMYLTGYQDNPISQQGS